MAADDKFVHLDLESEKKPALFTKLDPPPYSSTIVPSKEVNNNSVDQDFDDEEFEDETIVERIIALKEMFPEGVRNKADCVKNILTCVGSNTFSISKTVAWFVASTSAICFLPILLELERVQLEEQEAVQQRTMMLGPQAAGGSNLAGFSATMPNVMSN